MSEPGGRRLPAQNFLRLQPFLWGRSSPSGNGSLTILVPNQLAANDAEGAQPQGHNRNMFRSRRKGAAMPGQIVGNSTMIEAYRAGAPNLATLLTGT